MMTDIPVNLAGLGFWAPGHAGVAPFLSGDAPDPSVRQPAAAILPPTLRRRSSLLTRAAVEAFSEAAASAGADLRAVPTVWASAYGEIDNTIAILEMMRGDGMPSPTRFHNSVHNTASGTASIAQGNRAFSTAIAAGAETVRMGFTEAAALLASGCREVTAVFFDEPPPPPFAPTKPWPLCAAAFHLTRPEAEDPSFPIEPKRLTLSSILAAARTFESAGGDALPERLRPFDGHPILPALAFLHVLSGLPDRPETAGSP